jgi:hypothetical protein
LDYFKTKQFFGYKDQSFVANNLLQKEPSTKRILIVDDDPDITFTFKTGIEYGSLEMKLNYQLQTAIKLSKIESIRRP